MDNDRQSISLSLRKLPLSLRFIIKSFAFTLHHKHLRPLQPDKLNFSTTSEPTTSEFISEFIKTLPSWIGLLVYIGSYIGLLGLLARVTWVILAETYHYFNSKGVNTKSLSDYIRYGVEK